MSQASERRSVHLRTQPQPAQTMTLFASLWAVAAIFHATGPGGRATQVFIHPTAVGLSHVLLSVGAIWLLCRPSRTLPLLSIAVLGLITAGLEAPTLGNHWLIAAFVNLALLLSALAAMRAGRVDRDRLASAFLPLARWCLVLFYAFAAFAKLNSDFFDPAVSCSTFYVGETLGSFGLTTGLPAHGGLTFLLPFVTAATELSIPVLLLIRRMRNLGVVLGLVFHSLIALDLMHPFIDFSSVLIALFVLFLPGQLVAEDALDVLQRSRARVLIPWIVLTAAVFIAVWVGRFGVLVRASAAGTWLLWWVFDIAVVVGVVTWVLRNRGQVLDRPLRLRGSGPLWLAVVPMLVVLNGVLPYLELRTAYAYTMYSNLRMVDGKSNHLIVRSSLPLGDRQTNLVRLLATSDPGLAMYVVDNYLLTWDSFRAYLADHQDVAVSYQRGGRRYDLEHASDDGALITPPPLISQKLLAMRAIDGNDQVRCQEAFLPAL